MKNIGFEHIKINDGFWKVKQDMVKNSTLYAVYNRFVDTHRFDALSCTWKEGEPDMPHIFWDSDVAKWIEGAAYLLLRERDADLEQKIDDMTSQYRDNMYERIRTGKCTDEGSILFSEILTDFERIGDHAVNIAEWVEFSVTGVHKDDK